MREEHEGLATDGVHLQNAQGQAVTAGLVEQRRVIAERLKEGASGADVTGALTDLADGILTGCYRNTLREGGEVLDKVGRSQCCCVAVGSYGRRELAPYSDIEVMFLFRSEAGHVMPSLSKSVLSVWGAGFGMHHSIRTIEDCIRLSNQDLAIRTSLMDARFLSGSAELFQEFQRRFLRRVVTRGVDEFMEELVTRRRREYEECGGTVYALEPNLLKGRGGLRDLHLLRWIGMARWRTGTVQAMAERGLLRPVVGPAVTEAQDFLWRVRGMLHFHTRMAHETLSFEAQVWLAGQFGFRDQPHLMGVEQFMQEYYRHAMTVHDACVRVLERCRRVPLRERIARFLSASRVEGDFVVRGDRFDVSAGGRSRVLENPFLILRLFDLARSGQGTIEAALLDDIREHGERLPADAFCTAEIGATFVNILSGPWTARTLAALHRAHLLEKLIPAMARVRGLKPFTLSHLFPIDEHGLVAVAKAEALSQDQGMIGTAYRAIPRKAVVHLALLLQDLGKGQDDDHSAVGKRIAEEMAARLGFDESDRQILVFLVHHHLLMSRLAFGRDLDEEQALAPFIRAVGTQEALRALLVLTAADIAAGGVNAPTRWKESRLVELYRRAQSELSGEPLAATGPERLSQVARDVARQPVLAMQSGVDDAWVMSQLRQYPQRALDRIPPHRIAAHLAAISRLRPGEVVVQSEFSPGTGTCEYTVIMLDDRIPGIFYKIAGVLAANRLQILDAHILTRTDGVVVDTFQVADPEHEGAPPADRLNAVSRGLVSVLKGDRPIEELMRRSTHWSAHRAFPSTRQPTEVRVDNDASERFTMLDVLADDRQGLLYIIAQAIFGLGLSVHEAYIATRQDRAADVFAVTDCEGKKIVDRACIEAICAAVTEDIERFLGPGISRFAGAFDAS